MNNGQKSIKNFIYQAIGQVVSIAFGLILPRLFVTSYGSEVNGLLNSLSNFLVCLNLFEAGVGTASLQALYRPVADSDWNGINGVLAATDKFYKKTGRWYLIALLALSVFYTVMVESELSYWVICGCVFLSGISNVVNFYFQGKYVLLLRAEGKNYITTNLTTIINTLVSLAKVVLIYLDVNIVTILAVSFGIQCIQMAYILWYIHRNYKKLDLKVQPNYEAIGQKNFALVHQIGELVFKNTDVVILTMACGLKVVSVYSMFKMITSHLDQIMNILLNSVNFILGQTYQKDRERYKRMIDLFDSIYGAVAYALYAVAYYLFLPFMALYTEGVTDINYVDGGVALLFVLTALLSHSRVAMNQTISYAGHFKQTVPQSIVETVLNIVTSLVGVYFWGIYGVLIGTVVALAYRTNEIIIYANTKCLARKPWRTYGIYAVNIGMMFLTNWIFKLVFGGIAIDSYLKLILVGCGTTAISLVLFLGAQVLIFPHCREPLRNGIRRK